LVTFALARLIRPLPVPSAGPLPRRLVGWGRGPLQPNGREISLSTTTRIGIAV